jgi:hypothetical protein
MGHSSAADGEGVFGMKKRFLIGMFAAVCGMAAMGCGSVDAAVGSSGPVDPRLTGTWIYGDKDTVLEVKLRPNNTGTIVVYSVDGAIRASVSLKVRDGGAALINVHNGKVYSGRLEGENYHLTGILTEGDLSLSRAQKASLAGTTWTFTGPQLSITYVFAKDGTYRMTTSAAEDSGWQIMNAVSTSGFTEKTGTWTVSDFNGDCRITLEPADERYTSLNGSGKVDVRYAKTYTALFIDGAFYLDGLFYEGGSGE